MEPLHARWSQRDRVLQNLLLRVRPSMLATLLKKGLGVQRKVMTTEAGKFWVDPVSGFAALLCGGSYEPATTLALWSLVPPAGTFVDVGANEGYFSVIASKLVGPKGRVIVVEPQRRLREVLEANFELNDVRNVEIVDAAVSDRCGQAALHLSPDVNTGSTGLRQSTAYRTTQASVETTTLSALLTRVGLPTVDVMKMDIEGFEYEAILGSPELFEEKRIGALVLELHPRGLVSRGRTAEEIIGFLKGCGYHIDMRFEHNATNAVWVPSPVGS